MLPLVYKKMSLITVSALISSSVWAAGPQCTNLFEKSQNEAASVDVLAQFSPETKDIFKTLSADKDLPLAGKLLTQITTAMKNGTSFETALEKSLQKNGYTEDIIQSRLEKLKSKEVLTENEWRSILGDLSLEETHILFYGGDINSISPTSLIGQYLARTGSQTSFRAFPKKYGKKALGQKRLVVAVSADSFADFKKLILSNMHYMSVVGHANVLHKGKFYSFGGGKSEIRALGVDTPMPLVVVKTSEAQRLTRYMDLTANKLFNGWWNGLKQPWELTDYCATGGYSCCTHWIGNIPIGDKLVNAYTFPPEDRSGDDPVTQDLKPYAPRNKEEKKLVHVWKAPGHEQFADVIGQHEANVIGEMASPGYVIHTLLGPTSTERVPVVFMMTTDHKAKLDNNSRLSYEQPW